VFAADAVRGAAGAVRLDWKGIALESSSRIEEGPAAFCIAADDVRLFEGDATGRGNVVEAIVERVVPIGTSITVHARASNGEPLTLSAQKKVLARRGIGVGTPVRLSLMPDSIHVMPAPRTGA
ncbi:MAG TPA: TOBE domain-containing protein, partial [Quisquiliibacterium sp.]|nr:TOBE domain-containing protein [Quisquiliibacterium sp.]